jgi:eukaryotic-like serine/threonine-protein kinase
MPDDRVIAGKYRLIARLSKGGMGSVWRAQHLELDCPAAVKLLEPAFADSPEALVRFRREAQSAASLRSANIVQIFDFGVDDGTPYIAMELLRGQSLAERLAARCPLSPEETALILSQVARAAGWAHSMGIIHRDLKPGNIVISEDAGECVVKLVDFGIAKPSRIEMHAAPVTLTGAIMGTPQYMSPEQASGRGVVDHRTDIWSFGIVAFECLTGYHAFTAETLASLLLAICSDPLPVPSKIAPVPLGFDDWFAHCVHRDPHRRYYSIAEAADTLRTLCGVTQATPTLAMSASRVESPETLCSSSSLRGDTAVSNSSEANSTTHAASIVSLVADQPLRSNRLRYSILAGLFGLGALVAAVLRLSGNGDSRPVVVEPHVIQTTGASPKSELPSAEPVDVSTAPVMSAALVPAVSSPIVLPPGSTANNGVAPSRSGVAGGSAHKVGKAVLPPGSPLPQASFTEPPPIPSLATQPSTVEEETVESEFGLNRATRTRGKP